MAITSRAFPSTADPNRDALDDTIESSFPASDPPSSIPDPTYAPDTSYDEPAPAYRSDGRLAHAIEQQIAKLPPDAFLWAAVGSIGASAALQLAGKSRASLFVGMWAPVFLVLGVYDKLVEQLGTDRDYPA